MSLVGAEVKTDKPCNWKGRVVLGEIGGICDRIERSAAVKSILHFTATDNAISTISSVDPEPWHDEPTYFSVKHVLWS